MSSAIPLFRFGSSPLPLVLGRVDGGNSWDGLSRGPVGRQGELAGGQHSSLMSGVGVAVLPSLVGRFGSCMGSVTQQVLRLVFWFCFVFFLSCCVLFWL